MSYTAKDLEFLGRQVTEGKYVARTTFILALVLALLAGTAAGRYLIPSGGGTASVQKVPLGQGGEDVTAASQERELQESIRSHEAEVAAEPDNAQAWTHLGDLYYQAEQPAKAVQAYERSLSLKPGNTDVLVDCGTMYRALKQYDKAIEYYRKALGINPDHQNALFNSGVVFYYDLNRKEDGLNMWRTLVQKNPQAKAPTGHLVSDIIKELESAR